VIARFRVLLPYDIFIPHNLILEAHRLVRAEDTFLVHPPMQARLHRGDETMTSGVATRRVLDELEPQRPPYLAPTVVVDGENAFAANMLQIDLHRADFDRRRSPSPRDVVEKDPIVHSFFSVANDVLMTIRVVSNSPPVKPVWPVSAFWRIEYLDDNGESIQRDEINIRRRSVVPTRWFACGMTTGVWAAVSSLDKPYAPWETLLLDAHAMLPEVGPAIVLAYAALETFISLALDALATSSSIPHQIWNWINDRGNFLKEPSVSEQYDVLLQALIGHSLKENAELWEVFSTLRSARNAFAHEGIATTGKRKTTVSPQTAASLIDGASHIVAWVQALSTAVPRSGAAAPAVVEVFKPIEDPGHWSDPQ